MDFFLFILVNATLFIRPGEVATQLAAVPIFQIVTVACLAAATPKLINLWTSSPLVERPNTLCVLGFFTAIVLSHLSHGNIGMAQSCALDFAKVVAYFVLLVAVLNTPARLHTFLAWLLLIISSMVMLALLHHHGVIQLPSVRLVQREEINSATGESIMIVQLVGTGIFSDPNDLCLILATGILIGLYFSGDRRSGPFRLACLAPVALFAYALVKTQSRGGLLALLAGLGTLFMIRIGLRKTLIVGAVCLPVLLAVLGGRFSRMSTQEDTAQERIEKWRESMSLFRQAPLFGIGVDTLASEIGLVAHNSYVQAFAETGFLGGYCFLGSIYLSFRMLLRLGVPHAPPVDAEVARLRPFLLAILAAFSVGLYTLTRNYVATTYVPIGLAEVYQRLATDGAPDRRLRFNGRAAREVAGVAVLFIIFMYIFINIINR